jgi:hypothetical protein
MDFGPYDAFSSSDVLEMVNQQNKAKEQAQQQLKPN